VVLDVEAEITGVTFKVRTLAKSAERSGRELQAVIMTAVVSQKDTLSIDFIWE
jgi:hypothetical protein